MVEAGANKDHDRTADEATPFDIAAQNGQFEIDRFLVVRDNSKVFGGKKSLAGPASLRWCSFYLPNSAHRFPNKSNCSMRMQMTKKQHHFCLQPRSRLRVVPAKQITTFEGSGRRY